MSRTARVTGALALTTLTAIGFSLRAQPPTPSHSSKAAPSSGAITLQEAQQLAKDAYVFGYPLVTMELTRRHFTNVAHAEEMAAPEGQFANMKRYPTADFKGVTAPNADTLYSAAWLDVSKEPFVLEVPDVGNRFYMMPMLDAWTNVFADPGTRTTGTHAQKFLITGPRWSGTAPNGMKRLASPTAIVWIVGRTYSSGTPADYAAVHALQAQYRLTPLSAYGPGKTYTPPVAKVDPSIDTKTTPRDQVDTLSGKQFFELLAQLMKANQPSPADAPMLAKLARIGIVPGQDFDASKLDPQVAAAIDRAPRDAVPAIQQALERAPNVNGWLVSKAGDYGTQYLFRAAVAFVGLGANRPEDAIYPTAKTDMNGKPLDASKNDYVITFPSKDDLPPVKGFWSITMYDPTFFFVKNALNRQTLSSRDKLVANKDGSIDLYFQSHPPAADKKANWLPSPDGPFVLMLRMYWPTDTPPSILDGSWKPPGVRAVPRAPASAQR